MDEFKLDRLPDHEEETLIAEVQRVAGIIVADKITRTEFDEYGLISSSGLGQRFGSWQAVLEKAGLGHRYCEASYSPKNDAIPARHLSNEELLEILASVSRLTGKSSVTQSEFTEHTKINAHYLSHRFGSWRAALEIAGLQQSPGGKRYTDEECFENMLKVWTHCVGCSRFCGHSDCLSKVA